MLRHPMYVALALLLEYCQLILSSTHQFIENFSTFLPTFNRLEKITISDSPAIPSLLTFALLDREHELVQEWRSTCPKLKMCKFDGKQINGARSSYRCLAHLSSSWCHLDSQNTSTSFRLGTNSGRRRNVYRSHTSVATEAGSRRGSWTYQANKSDISAHCHPSCPSSRSRMWMMVSESTDYRKIVTEFFFCWHCTYPGGVTWSLGPILGPKEKLAPFNFRNGRKRCRSDVVMSRHLMYQWQLKLGLRRFHGSYHDLDAGGYPPHPHQRRISGTWDNIHCSALKETADNMMQEIFWDHETIRIVRSSKGHQQ